MKKLNYNINNRGLFYIDSIERKSKKMIYIMILLFAFSLTLSVIKIGWNLYALLPGIISIIVLYITVYTGSILPKKIANRIVRRIEISDSKIIFYNTNFSNGETIEKGKWNEINFHNSLLFKFDTFNDVIVFKNDSSELYIIGDFFDDSTLKEILKIK